MTEDRVFSLRNPWFIASVGGVVAIALLAAIIGLVWIPSSQDDKPGAGLWDRICSAAGLAVAWHPLQQPSAPVSRASNVIVTAQMMGGGDSSSIGRGATLAMRCTTCHGARGMSEADSPNLAGQYASAIYKQLRDFKAGQRQSAIMAPLVADLSDRDMRDVSAYYAYLPRVVAFRPTGTTSEMPVIVKSGAPMRNIAVCGSCHGDIDRTASSPWLGGEPEAYVLAQLRSFAAGTRRNDINAQMRNVARQMTGEEMAAASRYYANR